MTEHNDDLNVSTLEDLPENITLDDIEDVNLLGVEFKKPKRKARSYDAEDVDRVLRSAQQHLDTQYKFIQDNFSTASSHAEDGDDSDVSRLRFNAVLEQLDSVQNELSDVKRQLAHENSLNGQLRAANAELREELRNRFNAPIAEVEVAEEKTSDVTPQPAETASGILMHAERVAQEYITEAQEQAELAAQVRVAEAQAQAERDAEARIEEAQAEAERIIQEAQVRAEALEVERNIVPVETLRRIQEIATDALSEHTLRG